MTLTESKENEAEIMEVMLVGRKKMTVQRRTLRAMKPKNKADA